MLAKFTLKNMFEKPLRLFVLLLCITVASFAGCLAADIGGTIKSVFYEMMSNVLGSLDFLMTTDGEISDSSFAGCADANIMYVQEASKRELRRDDALYTYAFSESVSIWAFDDMDKAVQMGLVDEAVSLKDDEAAISRSYSEEYGYQVGDKITLTDIHKETFEVTVRSIFKEKGIFKSGNGYVLFTPVSVANRINGTEHYMAAMVDVVNDDNRDAFMKQFLENEPKGDATKLYIADELDKTIQSVTSVCGLVFVLTFLLVIFVTASFTEKIVQERMSVIGTLRSIGISRRKTTLILLMENVAYGLVGSGIGCLLYALLRPLWTSALVQTSGDLGVETSALVKDVSPMLYLGVMIGAVLIELLIPMNAVLSAVKTPIRDIIFANRDTEYQVSRKRTVIGACLIAGGLIFGFLIPSMFCNILAVLMIAVGIAFTVQAIIRFVTEKLAVFFEKRRMPTAEFAACEAGSKKADMGNAVLAVTTIIAAAAIFLIGTDMIYWSKQPQYNADVVIDGFEDVKRKDMDYITDLKGVDEADFIYSHIDSVKPGRYVQENLGVIILDDAITVFAQPESDMLTGLGEVHAPLGDDEVLMDQSIAKNLDIKRGETKELTFRCTGIFPVTRTVTLVDYVETVAVSDAGAIILSPSLYHLLYGSKPTSVLIRSTDPELAKKSAQQAITEDVNIQTREEYSAERVKDSRSLRMGLYAVIAGALVLTMIGISGNQLVGFEARRKEFALLHSTAMSRGQIVKLIFLENGISFGISVLLAVLFSIPVTMIIQKIFVNAAMGLTFTVRPAPLLGFLLIIWLVIMLTTLSPIRRLRRMNTADEIKYE